MNRLGKPATVVPRWATGLGSQAHAGVSRDVTPEMARQQPRAEREVLVEEPTVPLRLHRPAGAALVALHAVGRPVGRGRDPRLAGEAREAEAAQVSAAVARLAEIA